MDCSLFWFGKATFIIFVQYIHLLCICVEVGVGRYFYFLQILETTVWHGLSVFLVTIFNSSIFFVCIGVVIYFRFCAVENFLKHCSKDNMTFSRKFIVGQSYT